MNEYRFTVLDVVAEPYAVAPQLTARLRVDAGEGRAVHAIVLRCQVRVEPQLRRYETAEQEGLRGMFGEPDRWAGTVRPFQWMQCSATVPGFTGRTDLDLPMPCTYDLDVVGARYLHALGSGTVPLSFLFSGTVFTPGTTGFAVEQIPWSCEARHRMPVAVWRQMIESYYPNSGWLRAGSDVLTRLAGYRDRHGLTSWDETFQRLLAAADGPAS
ncbi:DUF6084 family protein [Actinoplanes aureus]|uniref:Uncharacterized protein n=1 Tax=Actinoplanes aureus TaxID=2792083 RepID=A0A931FYZ0_9ACTN|nr:DUF6084 family protein [Actinoplanes aureus]MBG0565108.1 hypothetical protein [Actinoplanes aureus]